MRTTAEILKRVEDVKETDFLGFGSAVLVMALDFESAKPFLKDDVASNEWAVTTDATLLRDALEYLEFAWGKVEDHRGISAERSVAKMTEYAWLLGDDALVKEIEDAGYAQYGAPKLAVINKKWGVPLLKSKAIQRMVAGKPCTDGCNQGCGIA